MMFTLGAHSYYQHIYFNTADIKKNMLANSFDVVTGVVLIIIGALCIKGIIPGCASVAPAAVLVVLGVVEFVVGTICRTKNERDIMKNIYVV